MDFASASFLIRNQIKSDLAQSIVLWVELYNLRDIFKG